MEGIKVKKIWKILFLVLMLVLSFSGCRQKTVQKDNRELVRTGEKSSVFCFLFRGK